MIFPVGEIYVKSQIFFCFTVTTISPNVATIKFPDFRSISIADLPGLIEGAWKNYGMGHSFLKHVERTNLILFIIDINGFQMSAIRPYRSPIETFLLLNKVSVVLLS